MRYMGSKRKIADKILPIILQNRKPAHLFVEPMCGGCNITVRVSGNRLANDVHPELIAMYRALVQGWKPPRIITEDMYNRLKQGLGDPELRGYAGFTHSFGGKYFDTYRRNPTESAKGVKLKSNYQNMKAVGEAAYNMVMKMVPDLIGVEFTCGQYYDVPIPAKSIIYCDPPYRGTASYTKGGKFPHDNFFDWCRAMHKEGHRVYVSEYNAPEDFVCLWEQPLRKNINPLSSGMATEKLFTLL